jgi:hypothetical protein
MGDEVPRGDCPKVFLDVVAASSAEVTLFSEALSPSHGVEAVVGSLEGARHLALGAVLLEMSDVRYRTALSKELSYLGLLLSTTFSVSSTRARC